MSSSNNNDNQTENKPNNDFKKPINPHEEM